MNGKTKRVYFNQKQIDFVLAPQKIKTVVAGRGWGKSTVIALILLFMLEKMARAKIFFSSTTIEQIKNMTLPPVIAKLAEMGIIEGRHFVVGKDPWGANSRCKWFARPISPVKKFDNVITFWNGLTVVMLSAAKPNSQRGGSYDAGIVDEAAFVKRAFWEKVLLKMVRGNLYRFDTPLHHSIFILTSQPRTPDGMWVLAMEQMAATFPDMYLFLWASARDNQVVLGDEWFKTQQRTSTSHLEYLIEVENIRLKKLPDGFYHRLDEKRHTYHPIKDYMGTMLDVRPDELLEVSLDFSGKFNCASIWQEQDGVERCVRQAHVKDGKKIRGLVDDICEMFKDHRFKYVRLWGEPRGRDRNPIDEDIFTIIKGRFEHHEWGAEIMVQKGVLTKRHKERFTFIETIMDEDDARLPKVRFNADACENIMISMQGTDINPDYSKNKSAEKDENFPQENAPHYGDTVDYYLYYKHAWRLNDESNQRARTADVI